MHRLPDASETMPISITHEVDTDLDELTGECSFHYNFLLYTFSHLAGPIVARSYLDTSSEVNIMLPLDLPSDDPALTGILRYLRARYSVVMRLTQGGYVAI